MDVTWFILLLFVYLINDVSAGVETAATKRNYANIKEKLYTTKDGLHRKNLVLDARPSLKKSTNKEFHYIKKTGVGSDVFKRWPLRLPYEVPMDSGPILNYENFKMLHTKASVQQPKKTKNQALLQTVKKLTNPASFQTTKKATNATLVQTLKKKLNPNVSLRSSIFPCLYDGTFEKKKQCIEKAPEDFPEELSPRDQKIKVMYHRLPEDVNGAEDHIVKIVHRPNTDDHRPNTDVQVNEPQKMKNLRKLQYQETTKSNEENNLTNVNKQKFKLKKFKDDSKDLQNENNSLNNSEAQSDENTKTNALAQAHNSKFHRVTLQNNEKKLQGNENYESAIEPAKEDLNFLPVTEKSQEEIQDLKNDKNEEKEKSISSQQLERQETEKPHKMKTGLTNQKIKDQNENQDIKINKAAQKLATTTATKAVQLVVNTDEQPKQQEGSKVKNNKQIKEKNEDLSETWKALAQVQEESLNKKPQASEQKVQQESLNKTPTEPESNTEESKLSNNNKLNKESKEVQQEPKQELKTKEDSRLKQSLLKEEAQFQSEQRPSGENKQIASNEDANQESVKQHASEENKKLLNLNFRPRKEKPDQRPSDNLIPVNSESPLFQHTQQMKQQADQMNYKPCKGLNQQQSQPCAERFEHSNEHSSEHSSDSDPNIDNQFFQLWREDLSIKQKFIERMNNMDTKYLNLLYRMGKSLDSIARTINHFGTVLTEQSKGEAIRHALSTQQLPPQQRKQDNSFYKRRI